MADPFFSDTVLMLHLDGADGATAIAAIVDDSAAHHAASTVAGSLTTAQKKWGTASYQCSGGSGGYIIYANHADWDLGAGQFTIECWARRTAAISGVRTLVSHWANSVGTFGWQLAFNGAALCFFYSTTGSNNPTVQGNYTSTLNDWDFFAVDRDASNDIRVYAGTPAGITVIGGPTNVPATIFHPATTLLVGNDGTNTRGWPGQIDDLRITKGVARYAGTCPVPTGEFPGATDPIIDVAGVAREVLLTTNPALTNAGLVREVLLASLTGGLVAGVVREVLLSSPPVVVSGGQTAVSMS